MQLTRCWPFYTTLFENKIILSQQRPKKNGSRSKNYSKQIAAKNVLSLRIPITVFYHTEFLHISSTHLHYHGLQVSPLGTIVF